MKDLTKGNIYKTFFMFAAPLVLSSILSQCYTIINTIIAGKMLGDNALAVVGSISPLETFINAIFWGYGTGVGIHAGHLFGAGDKRSMKRVILVNFTFVSVVLMILSAFLLIFRYNLYDFLKIDPLIIEECNRYFIISTAGKIFVLLGVNCSYIFHAIGDTAFPFWMSVISTALHIGISIVAVTVFHMGVEGLAVANVLSYVIVSSSYLFRLFSYFKKMGLRDYKVSFDFKVIKETCKYSVSTTVQQSIMYCAGMLLSPLVNAIGGAAAASYTVSLRVYDINATVYQNSARTVGSYTAQCSGAKKYHLLKKGLIVGFIQNALFVLPFLFVSVFFARPVAMVFYAADADPVSIAYTLEFMRYCLPFLVFNIVANLFHHFFRGIGYMKALLITTIAGSVGRVIVSWLLIPYFGIRGYYAAWVISWLFDGGAGLVLYFFGKWRKVLGMEEKN